MRALAPPDDGSGDSSGDGSGDGSDDGSGRRGAVEILAVAITTGPALEIERSSHHDAAETERFMSPVQATRRLVDGECAGLGAGCADVSGDGPGGDESEKPIYWIPILKQSSMGFRSILAILF